VLSPVYTRRFPVKDGFSVVSCSVDCKGDALRLLARSDLARLVFSREQSPGSASFPLTRSDKPYAALLEVTNHYSSYEIEIHDLVSTFPLIERLPGERILIVSPRCTRYKDGSHELNAKIYGLDGKLQEELLLGDGIQHLQVDQGGRIWVGYFDEGVYGNFGWGGSGNAAPVGAAGLVCFSDKGEKLWEYQPVSGTDSISDVYALNVFGDEAWAYYYTGFPLVRVGHDWKVAAWISQTAGARAFAVHDESILLFGGYDDGPTACRLLHLGNTDQPVENGVTLSLPDGGKLADATMIGRGHILHVFAGEIWYQFSARHLNDRGTPHW
jgi:hypothetical protein